MAAYSAKSTVPTGPPESNLDHGETHHAEVPAAVQAVQPGAVWGSMFSQDKCSAVPCSSLALQLR